LERYKDVLIEREDPWPRTVLRIPRTHLKHFTLQDLEDMITANLEGDKEARYITLIWTRLH
jgi:hypothetical protein